MEVGLGGSLTDHLHADFEMTTPDYSLKTLWSFLSAQELSLDDTVLKLSLSQIGNIFLQEVFFSNRFCS